MLHVRHHYEAPMPYEVTDAASLPMVQILHATMGKQFHHWDDSVTSSADAATASIGAVADTAIAESSEHAALTALCCSIITGAVHSMQLGDLDKHWL